VTDPLLLDFPDSFETERLLIRPPQRADAQMVYEAILESQAELNRWMAWSKDNTLEDAIRYTRRALAQFIMRENLAMTIWRKADQHFVGNTGLHAINWEQRKFEIGYWLRTSAYGQGYMTEAVNGLTRFCFDVLEATRVEIRCDAENERSAAVARRTGYTQEAHLRSEELNTSGMLSDTLIFGMIRTDYDAKIGQE